MEILLNDSIPIPAWKEFLQNNAHATPFQSPEFYTILNSSPSLSAEAIAVTDSNSIKALAVVSIQKESGLKYYFSRRGIIYGGPLIEDNDKNDLVILLEYIYKRLKGQVIYIEVRNYSDYSTVKEIFNRSGYQYFPWMDIKIDTTDLNSVLANMSSSRLRQIRKAKRNGVTWTEAKDKSELDQFFRILSALYNNKVHKPVLPREFFNGFLESNLGKYLLVKYNDETIGGIMCPILEGMAIYEFYVCGLDSEYKNQYPSVMATWAAIEYANQNNIPVFDFMGAGKPDEEYGVREFKARFGGERVEYGRFLKINNPFLYKFGKLGLKIQYILKG